MIEGRKGLLGVAGGNIGSIFFLALLFSIQAMAQAPVFNPASVNAGSTANITIDWIDGGTDAAGVQIDNIEFSGPDIGDIIAATVYVTDVFSGEEVVCGSTSTTIAPNVNVFCNTGAPPFTMVNVFSSAGAPLGDLINFARIRLEADADAEDGSAQVDASWQTFDGFGGDIDSGTVNAAITILEVAAVLDVQPDFLNFGDQFTGSTPAPQAVTISNQGADGVDLEVTNISITGDFALDGPSCVGAVIADGNSCIQNVVFSPASDGPHAGMLTVFSDAGEVLNDAVSLSGNAISPPTDLVFTVSPHYGVEGGPLFWGVEVQVLDANGALYTADNTTIVEITLETDPTGAATLSGNTEMMVDNGVATFAFTDLSIDLVGNGFRLQASDQAGSLDSALSGFFNVVEDQLLRDRFEQ